MLRHIALLAQQPTGRDDQYIEFRPATTKESVMKRIASSAGVQVEHVDVLIVGAGISGIGAAYYLPRITPAGPTPSSRRAAPPVAPGTCSATPASGRTPTCTPSATSSSRGATIMPSPTADEILAYLRQTAAENGIDEKIRFHHKVLRRRVVERRSTLDGRRRERARPSELVQFSANWIFMAGGYYRYDQGYTPEFKGRDRFEGQIVHPQHWPEDLDYTGKKVVIIGSGATAVTLVPAMADTAAHVTMLQRSPTYIMAVPSKDEFANTRQKVLGDKRGYALSRRKNIVQTACRLPVLPDASRCQPES